MTDFIGWLLTFGILLIGSVGAIYAASVSREGADMELEAMETMEPVVEAVLFALPWLILLVAAFGLIAVIGWMLAIGPRTSGSRGMRR